MHHRQDLPPHLRSIANDRDGVLAVSELADCGLSRHSITRLRAGWHRQTSGVYLIDRPEPTWTSLLWIGLLTAGDGACAYGDTALRLAGMVTAVTDEIHVLTPYEHPREAIDGVQFHRNTIASRVRLTTVDPPRVGFADAAIDAATGRTPLDAIALVTRVLQEKRVRPDDLRAVIAGRTRVRHRRLLRDVIDECDAGVESVLEHAYRARVHRPHGLPEPVWQYVVPETRRRVDGAYVERRGLLQLDGVRFHDRDRDRRDDLKHTAMGYSTLRVTWSDVHATPRATAAMVAGWLGLPTVPRPCSRCPHPRR